MKIECTVGARAQEILGIASCRAQALADKVVDRIPGPSGAWDVSAGLIS